MTDVHDGSGLSSGKKFGGLTCLGNLKKLVTETLMRRQYVVLALGKGRIFREGHSQNFALLSLTVRRRTFDRTINSCGLGGSFSRTVFAKLYTLYRCVDDANIMATISLVCDHKDDYTVLTRSTINFTTIYYDMN